jgi:hypothetical protein
MVLTLVDVSAIGRLVYRFGRVRKVSRMDDSGVVKLDRLR